MTKQKRITKYIVLALSLLLFSIIAVTNVIAIKAENNDINGGYIKYDFDLSSDLRDFDLYSSYKENFYTFRGLLWSDRSEEKKAILNPEITTDFDLSVELFSPVENGYLDGGVYIGLQGPIYNGIDMVNGYEVHVIRENSNNVISKEIIAYRILVYKYDYEWLGKVASTTVFEGMDVKLNLRVRGNMLYVMSNDGNEAYLSYEMSDYTGGKVGLRSYNCQMGFDNLMIKSAEYEVDKTGLGGIISQAESLTPEQYIAESQSSLQSALTAAISVFDSGNDQDIIDETTQNLNKVLDNLITKYSYQQLQDIITQANEYSDEMQNYTPTSSNCLTFYLANANVITESDSEKDISLAAYGLEQAISSLVKYTGN